VVCPYRDGLTTHQNRTASASAATPLSTTSLTTVCSHISIDTEVPCHHNYDTTATTATTDRIAWIIV
jgi:hypothetical protein